MDDMKLTVVWDMTPCIMVDTCQCFGEVCISVRALAGPGGGGFPGD
jgi:hypothetical protein